jgi:hypothetical protein
LKKFYRVDSSPSFFKQECELVIAYFALSLFVQIVEQLFYVLEGELEAHMVDRLSKLIDRN